MLELNNKYSGTSVLETALNQRCKAVEYTQ